MWMLQFLFQGFQLIVLLVLQDGDIMQQLNQSVQKLEFSNRYRLQTFATTAYLITANTIALCSTMHYARTNPFTILLLVC